MAKSTIKNTGNSSSNKKKVLEIDELLLKNMKLNLDLAGIYFVHSVQQLKEGQIFQKKLEVEIQKYNSSYQKRLKKHALLSEEFWPFQLHELRDIEVHYEPVVRCYSACKILLICAAEAYINEVAAVKLSGKVFSEFDKLSILGKWIFAQDVLKLKKKMNLGQNPLQDFASLISERNKLVHFKGMKKELLPLEIPDFLGDLGLNSDVCNKNIDAVRNLIRTFSLNWSGSNGPGWLDPFTKYYRNPCFYSVNREADWVLYSDKYDSNK
jgi:hypothetical protein